MQKKAQVTLFFLLGVVILVVFIFLFAVNNAVFFQAEKVIEPLSSQAKTYLASCMDEAFFDATELLFTQGGAFLDDIHDGEDLVLGEEYASIPTSGTPTYVTFGIRGPSARTAADIDLPSSERFADTRHVQFNDYTLEFISRNFGTVTLPALCDPDGPNAKRQSANDRCNSYAYRSTDVQHSVQEALTFYVTQRVASCITPQTDLLIGTALSSFGTPQTRVIFGKERTQVELLFADRPPITRTYDVRMLKLYGFALRALHMNARDPYFSLLNTTQMQKSPDYLQGFSTDFAPVSLSTGPAHLVTISDAQSVYRGNTLMLNFIIQEREPFCDPDPAQATLDGIPCTLIDPDPVR